MSPKRRREPRADIHFFVTFPLLDALDAAVQESGMTRTEFLEAWVRMHPRVAPRLSEEEAARGQHAEVEKQNAPFSPTVPEAGMR